MNTHSRKYHRAIIFVFTIITITKSTSLFASDFCIELAKRNYYDQSTTTGDALSYREYESKQQELKQESRSSGGSIGYGGYSVGGSSAKDEQELFSYTNREQLLNRSNSFSMTSEASKAAMEVLKNVLMQKSRDWS